MATTRIIPLHAGKGRTVGKAISDIIDYVKNPEKTDHGRLITSYQCDSRVADAQFLLDKQTYAARTGRVRGCGRRDRLPPAAVLCAGRDHAGGSQPAGRGAGPGDSPRAGTLSSSVPTSIRLTVHNHIIWNSTALEWRPQVPQLLGQHPRRPPSERHHLRREQLLHCGGS